MLWVGGRGFYEASTQTSSTPLLWWHHLWPRVTSTSQTPNSKFNLSYPTTKCCTFSWVIEFRSHCFSTLSFAYISIFLVWLTRCSAALTRWEERCWWLWLLLDGRQVERKFGWAAPAVRLIRDVLGWLSGLKPWHGSTHCPEEANELDQRGIAEVDWSEEERLDDNRFLPLEIKYLINEDWTARCNSFPVTDEKPQMCACRYFGINLNWLQSYHNS